MLRSTTIFVLGFAIVSAIVPAQAGNGGNGDLEPSPMAVGANFNLKITGGAGQSWALFLSDNPGVFPIPGVGTVWIDVLSPAFGQLASGVLPAPGNFTLTAAIPNNPAFLNLVLYTQAVVTDPTHPSGIALTRAVRLDFENPDSFTPLPPLGGARVLATAELLKDGRVIVCGGGGGTITNPTGGNSTEIYEPYSRSWSAGPNMTTARGFHTSVALNDGRVLICGGGTASGVTTSCEIYDPATNTFSIAASMGTPRGAHAATLLNDGRVLVTGGTTNFTQAPGSTTPLGDILNASVNTGEVYDPVANTWTPVSNTMASKRWGHTQTLLNDGRVVCISGLNGTGTLLGVEVPAWTNTSSIYNPATNAFTAGPTIATMRTLHRATRMPNGEVFVSGGFSPTLLFGVVIGVVSTNSCVKLNSTATTFTNAGTMAAGALAHGQVLLKNGNCHLSGGSTIALAGTTLSISAVDGCAVRAGGATALTPTASLPAARGTHFAVRLWDGSVLIGGGADAASNGDPSVLLYTP